MRKIVLLYTATILIGCSVFSAHAEDGAIIYSDINDDEFVVFFRTSAWLDEANQAWHVPIHGWIYEPQNSTARKATLATILKKQYDLAPNSQTEANFTRRANLMIADNERGKRLVVNVGGSNYVLPQSGADGHFKKTLTIPMVEIDKFVEGNLIKYSAVTSDSEARTFSGETLLVQPIGLSVISDIDDTIKISNVGDSKKLFEHTFFLDFGAVPGMAQLYKNWSDHNVSLHFVSSSPWQLYSPLEEFIDRANFPWSTFSLKSLRFRDETLLNLLKKGTETKPPQIESILKTYQGRKFILVGDSGEQDPEVYAALMRKYPEQILRVYIRNVTQESPKNRRFEPLFENIDKNSWELFENPLTLLLPE